MVLPKYNLIEDFIHHILSGCDVHYCLCCHDELFEQVLMFFRAVAHWETNLNGIELVPSLDLRRGQHHRCTVMNAVEGNLLNMSWDVLEASVDEGTPSIDGICGRISRQLEGLQPYYQG